MAGHNNIDRKLNEEVVFQQEPTQAQDPKVAALIEKSAPFKKQAEKAKGDLKASYASAPKKIDSNVNKLNLIDAQIDHLTSLIAAEEAKGENANVDLIIRHARNLQALLNSASGFTDYQNIRRMNDELDEAIKDLQKSYKNKKELLLGVGSGALMVVGGFAGLAPWGGGTAQGFLQSLNKSGTVTKLLGGTSFYNNWISNAANYKHWNDMIQSITQTSQPFNGVGQGVGQFGTFARSEQEAVRAGIQHVQQKLNALVSEYRQSEAGNKGRSQEQLRAALEEIQLARRLFETIASNR